MKKALFVTFLFALFLLVPRADIMAKSFTKGFGGKILSVGSKSGSVKCSGSGTIFYLTSNVAGLVQAGTSGFTQKGGVSKSTGTASGLYKAIPYYAGDSNRKPSPGRFILGRANSVPTFSKCHEEISGYQIPIPVFETKDYQISK